jgi:hypothetical protein
MKKVPQYSFEEWVDISELETARCYHFPDGSTYAIEKPVKLLVKPSGSHKLVDAEGYNHYVRAGWNAFSFSGKWGIDIK